MAAFALHYHGSLSLGMQTPDYSLRGAYHTL